MDGTTIDQLFGQYGDATAGCAIAVVRGADVYLQGYGQADLEARVPITPSTRFNLGSTSKQFTALALLLLEADGLLSLDDDVRDHLLELHDFGSPITLWNLLHHTSGLRDTYPDMLMLSGWRFTDHITQADALRLIFNQRELSFEPGSEHLYSNANYVLLAEIIARRSGATLAEFSRHRIFGPLGMGDTLIMDDASEIITSRAQSYFEAGEWRNLPLTDAVLGSTNVYSTADDMARWLINFRTGALGGPEVWERMLQPGILSDGTVLAYGGGLQVGSGSTYRGRPVIEHGGQHGGYCTSMYWFPEDDLGIALMLNHFVGDSRERLLAVADLFLESEETAPPPPQVEDRRIEIADTELEALAGTFFDSRRRAVREVPLVDGALRYMGLELVPTGPGAFTFAEAPGVEVTFDDRGVTVASEQALFYERVEPLPDGAIGLEEFTGRYESTELGVVWRIAVDGDRLRVKRHKYVDTLMRPMFADTFVDDWTPVIEFPWEYLVEFERTEGRVAGLRVSGQSARGLWFERIEMGGEA
jgi:CubicO group peptidase (beta-lactamase class C family)